MHRSATAFLRTGMSSVEPACPAGGQATVPAVTVLIPVYNAGPLLREAVDSILAQTFTDFECLVIDDGSTDGSMQALVSIDDPRLRIVRNPKNLGLIATLNRGLELARAPLLARMDQDDISHPDRLRRQVETLHSRPDLTLIGGWARMIGPEKQPVGFLQCPVEPADVLNSVLSGSPFVHPCVMGRTAVFRELGGYPTNATHAEDYALWLEWLLKYDGANIPEYLLDYRIHPGQISQRNMKLQRQTADRLRIAAAVRFRDSGRLPLAISTPMPCALDRLRGRQGTLGADHAKWANLLWRMGRGGLAVRTALSGLRFAPLSSDLYRLLTPPKASPRYWWRRIVRVRE